MSKPAATDRSGIFASEGEPPIVIDAAGRSVVEVPQRDFLLTAQYHRLGDDLLLTAPDGTTVLVRGFFSGTGQPLLRDMSGAEMHAEMVALLATSPAEGQLADATGTAMPTPIGIIERVEGAATIVRADGSRAPASAGTFVFERDVIETAAGSRLAIRLADDAALAMDASTRLVLDGFRGERDASGHFTFAVLKGAIAYLANAASAAVDVMTPQALISGNDPSFLIRVDDRSDGPYATEFFAYAGEARASAAGSTLIVAEGEAARLPGLGHPPVPIPSWRPDQADLHEEIRAMARSAQLNGPGQPAWTALLAETSPDVIAGEDPALAQIAAISPAAGGPGPAPVARPSIGGGTIVTMVEVPATIPVGAVVAPPPLALPFPDPPGLATPIAAFTPSLSESGIGVVAEGPETPPAPPPLAPLPNQAPIAAADVAAAQEDGPPVAIQVLLNDADADAGDVLTIQSVGVTGTVGSVGIAGTSVVYDPGTNFQSLAAGATATDTFTYTIADPAGATATATVVVTVTGVNDAPIAGADAITISGDSGGVPIDVLANDLDPDEDDTLAVIGVETTGTLGSVSFSAAGLTYSPGGGFQFLGAGATATDSFSYTVRDDSGMTSTAVVTVGIVGVNDAPVALDDSAMAVEDGGPIAIDVLANDSDPDAGDMTGIQSVDTIGTLGSVSFTASGLTYDPGTSFQALGVGATATDSFAYTIVDSGGLTSTARVSVTITGTNDAPVAAADSVAAVRGTAPIVIAVLANDTDVDVGDRLAISAVDTTGTIGIVGISGTSLTYDPGSGFAGLAVGMTAIDTFTYTIVDSAGAFATATVTVSATNIAPVAVVDAAAALEDGAAVGIDVLANDTDPDAGDSLAVVGVDTGATLGTVSFTSTSVIYDPGTAFQELAAGATALDSFAYTIADTGGLTSTAIVTVTVTGINDAPLAVADTALATEDGGAVVIAVLANDMDPDDGDSLSVVSVGTSGTLGAVTFSASGVTYDPGAGFQSLAAGMTATDTFTYTIRDAVGEMSSATVSVMVAGTNDAPIAVGDAANAVEDGGPVVISVLGNDSDIDAGDTLSILSVDATGTMGSVSILGDTLVYDPGNGFTALTSGSTTTDTFTYTLRDAAGLTSVATVTVTVSSLDDNLIGGGGADLLNGAAGSDTLSGNGGNDTLLGGVGNDRLIGGAGNDSLDGGEGDDTYLLSGTGEGTDTFRDTGASGIDTILALAAATLIRPAGGFSLASSGVEVISGNGLANVSILGGTAAELFDFTGVTLVDIALIDAGAGNDTVLGSGAADTIRGGTGDDSLDGGEGGDTYLLSGTGEGTDAFRDTGSSGIDTILALAAGTVIRPAGGFSLASSGVEVISGNGLANVSILGGTAAELFDFTGVTLVDVALIDAGAGNDTVVGSAGADVILGNTGNDSLDGGEGGDTYRVAGTGHGADLFRDTGMSGIDRIAATANNTNIGIQGDFSAGLTGIEEISAGGFANVVLLGDGNANSFDLSAVALSGLARIDAGAGNDTVIGSAGDDVILGNAGNDRLDGGLGSDTLIGGAGNDTLDGGEGSDAYLIGGSADGTDAFRDTGAAGVDRILATAVNTSIRIVGDFSAALTGIEEVSAGGFANVVLLGDAAANSFDLGGVVLDGIVIDGGGGNDTILGSTGDDLVQGGAGNDSLDGGEGSDTYRVTGAGSGTDIYADSGAAGFDRIVALANATTIGLGAFGPSSGIEEISAGGFTGVRVVGTTLADSLDFSATALVGITQIDAGAGNDTVVGSAGANVILGNTGNDSLDGGEGGDTYLVTGTGHGTDLYRDTGTSGIDRILATANNTRIGIQGDFSAALTGIEEISAGGFGNVVLLGDGNANSFDLTGIVLDGVAIDGGGGNDSILGSAGEDLILGNAGNDTLLGSGGVDTLQGGAGNDSLDGGEGGDTYRVTGTGDGVDLYRDAGTSGTDRILAAAANTRIGILGDFSAALTGIEEVSAGGFANVVLLGDAAANSFDLDGIVLDGIVIDGGGGNDTILGSAGDDLIQGGAGNDSLDGGEGSDTYRVTGTGSGTDIYADSGAAGFDRIVALANATTIGLGAFGPSSGIEEISAGGFTGVRVVGTTLADSLDFSATALVGITQIDAGAGNDTVVGSAGANVILGNTGNDSLDGGEGGDSYLVTGTGHGADLYRDTGASGIDRILATANNTNIGIQGDFSAALAGIEEISAGGFSNVALLGDAAANSFDLSAVALFGLARIDAGAGNDTVIGSAGDDVIQGNAGNDRLDGGLGNDTLIGGAGDDVFVMNLLSGHDRINDFVAGGVLDRIDLTAIFLADVDADGRDLDDVLALASMDGTNAVIDFGGGNTLTLVNVSLAALQPVDFIL